MTFLNTWYFTGGNPGLQTFTGLINTPFTMVDPSQAFVNLNFTSTAIIGYLTPSLAAVVGSTTRGGPDFQFQVDGGSTFGTSAVPEPASIAMTILGLGGFACGSVVARRRRAIV